MAPGCWYALGDVLEWTKGKWTGYVMYCKKPSYLILYGSKVYSFTVYKLCEFGI